METNKLRIFITVAKTESVRKSAEILNITPSAISKTLKYLQEELQLQLLVPSGRGLILTPEGRRLAFESERLLKDLDELKFNLKSNLQSQIEKPIRISTFEVFSTYFLDVLCDVKLSERKIILHESSPGELEMSVAQNQVDFGITYMPVPFPDVEHIKVTSIEMGTFKRKDSFLGIPIRDLPYVVPVMPFHGTPTRNQGLDGWPAEAFIRKVKYEVTLMESALELCRQGRCAGYFPIFVIQRHNKKYREDYSLVRHRIPKLGEACETDVYLVKRKDQAETDLIKLGYRLIRMGTKAPLGFGG